MCWRASMRCESARERRREQLEGEDKAQRRKQARAWTREGVSEPTLTSHVLISVPSTASSWSPLLLTPTQRRRQHQRSTTGNTPQRRVRCSLT
eukprot:3700097-Rhodomonas_salina.1